MTTTLANGLRADWVNAWLAAIGICHLCPQVRLRWTDEPEPRAEFQHPDETDLAELIADSLPDISWLKSLAIAYTSDCDDNIFKQKPALGTYRKRACMAMQPGDFSLSSSVTDLGDLTSVEKDELPHSPFNPPAPKGITLWQRLITCFEALDKKPSESIRTTLSGNAQRIQANGLGFDYLRIFSPTIPGGAVMIDPVVEVLAFFGLALFPVRGDGARDRTRGWTGGVLSAGSFTWPVWSRHLSISGVDALLDIFYAAKPPDWAQRMLICGYRSVPYRPKGSSDVTRGIASERVDW